MGKYDHLFITEAIYKPTPHKKHKLAVQLFSHIGEDSSGVPGTYLMEASMVTGPSAPDEPDAKVHCHCHDFDEYMAFVSVDPDNVTDLGAEIEFWMEDEKHVITESTCIFIPKFMMHLPMRVTRVDRPFMWITVGMTHKFHAYQHGNTPPLNEDEKDRIAMVTLGDKTYQVHKTFLDYMEYLKDKARKDYGL